ncbi:UvrD-helicase domain-containing protein [Winogradskyella immobilis]|uniref:UvrD-helicase domain-containing protein n=1 Tax=Winogradskyella immobilis TaxID=2816852 RepID=UPI001D0C2995|nr:UvrD-helicase domain-containing protein [Winogradskyella immobilis]MCG0015448.1 UvrD-helicase domain-containing protein [Winogradskyella immobilis]
MLDSSFKIYNASAGSGKTFTLAKSYLKLLIVSKYSEQFKHILALTFTNKAVGEMKTRIIDMLRAFSDTDSLKKPNSMFLAICEEMSIEPRVLQTKSKQVLKHIMHNYAAFDISTIDGFTHRIIRTFAFDLKLPVNFEVELDQDLLLHQAVDRLIAKAGSDKELTKTLVDFAIEKADDDKSWDISYDFNKISKLLVNENDLSYLKTLKDKTFDDFKVLKQNVLKKLKDCEQSIVSSSQKVLLLIEEAGLQFDDFNRKSLPNHFLNLSNKRFDIKMDSAWQTTLMEGGILYPKRVTEHIASIIEQIQNDLSLAFIETKALVFQHRFLKSVYKNITPLSVLNAIQNELKAIKEDQNILLISEFNTLINNEIKNQPTPFIYERLGEKFLHYFIDEFQDTSTMQWRNLLPLLDNSISSTNGSVMLVGDAKQAIYRWRGGQAEQFINLYNKTESPFYTEPIIYNLDTNYRSSEAIINFNNSFFKFISNHFLNDKNYQLLYENSKQNTFKQHTGFVDLNFLEFNKDDDKALLYSEETYKIITKCLDLNYSFKEITVIVRKKKEGIAIANYLTQKGIPIISSETLLINNSPKIKFINHILYLLSNPNDNSKKIAVLNFIAEQKNIADKHSFFKALIGLSITEIFKHLSHYNINISYSKLLQMPIYEVVECIIRSFSLVDVSDAYIQFYLDLVLEFSQKQIADILGFLDYFEKKKDSLSIAMPSDKDAVSIMTIHKSKGLEFPVVIFPFADLDIYRELEPKAWFPLDAEHYNGFDYALLNYNKDFENYGDTGISIFNKHQSQLELDNINLLYVALTRAVEHLYIISKKDISSKGIVNEKTYAGLLINYLKNESLWNENKNSFVFGCNDKFSITTTENDTTDSYQFISTSKESHNLKIITNSGTMWDTDQEEAIERGNLVHLILSKINTSHDIEFVLTDFINSGEIKESDASKLKKSITNIITHPDLKNYYTDSYTIYNEQDIITTNGNIIRPDRLVIKDNQAIIIDYKTGAEDIKHKSQLDNYTSVINNMGYNVLKKILVYINHSVKIVQV